MNCKTCKTKFKDNGKDYCSSYCYKKATTNKKEYPSNQEHLNWKEYWNFKLKGKKFSKLILEKFEEMNMQNGMGAQHDITPTTYWDKDGYIITQLFPNKYAK